MRRKFRDRKISKDNQRDLAAGTKVAEKQKSLGTTPRLFCAIRTKNTETII